MLSTMLLLAQVAAANPAVATSYTLEIDPPATANELGFVLTPNLLSAAGPRLTAKAKPEAPLPRVTTFHDETRVFWYAAGAGSVTSLATRVFLSIPGGLIFFNLGAAGIAGPAAMAVIVGAVALLTVIDSALSALASSLVFNNMSRYYKVDWMSGFLGQLAGNALSGSVFWLTFGFGGLALLGIENLGGLVSANLLGSMQTFSILGAMPAVVIAFLASLALPSLVGTWALAATAKAREKYKIDPGWQPYGRRVQRAVLPDSRRAFTQPFAVIPLPGT